MTQKIIYLYFMGIFLYNMYSKLLNVLYRGQLMRFGIIFKYACTAIKLGLEVQILASVVTYDPILYV